MVEGSCGMRGMVASKLQAERLHRLLRSVGLPDSRRYPGEGIAAGGLVPDERAQARNLGGTAEAAFRPKRGREAAFLGLKGV